MNTHLDAVNQQLIALTSVVTEVINFVNSDVNKTALDEANAGLDATATTLADVVSKLGALVPATPVANTDSTGTVVSTTDTTTSN